MNNPLSRLALNDEGFVFDPQTGDSYQVSETGMILLQDFKEGRHPEEIAIRLTERYEVSLDEAQRDCVDFLARLRQFNLA
jgi:hypothetical protein